MVNNFILSIYTKLLLTDQIFTSVSYTFISYMVMYEAKVMFNVLSTILEKHFNCTVPLSALLRQLRLLSRWLGRVTAAKVCDTLVCILQFVLRTTQNDSHVVWKFKAFTRNDKYGFFVE